MAAGQASGQIANATPGPMWSDASRGLPQPDMMYAQALTPVNMNDPVEVARWQAMNPGRSIAAPASFGTSGFGILPASPGSAQGSVQPMAALTNLLTSQGGSPYPSQALDIRQPLIRPAPIQLPTLPAVSTPPLADWNLPSAGNTGTDWGQAGMNTLAGLMTGQAVAKALGFDPLGAVAKAIGSGWDTLFPTAAPTAAQQAADAAMTQQNALAELAAMGGPPGGDGGGAGGAALSGAGAVPAAYSAYSALTAPTAAQQATVAAWTQADALAELAALQSGVTAAAPAAGAAGLAGANVGAGLTPAAVEAMTGLSTAAPVAATAVGAGTGALAGGVAGGMGGAAGAELGGMAAGSFAPALGSLGPIAALMAPLVVGMGVQSMSLGGNFKPAYDTAANSLVPKLASYEAQQLGAEILGGDNPLVQAAYPGMSGQLPAMDILAAADAIAAKIGFGQDAYQAASVVASQVPGYTNARLQIAPKLAEIMVRENRYPTQEEFLAIARQGQASFEAANRSYIPGPLPYWWEPR